MAVDELLLGQVLPVEDLVAHREHVGVPRPRQLDEPPDLLLVLLRVLPQPGPHERLHAHLVGDPGGVLVAVGAGEGPHPPGRGADDLQPFPDLAGPELRLPVGALPLHVGAEADPVDPFPERAPERLDQFREGETLVTRGERRPRPAGPSVDSCSGTTRVPPRAPAPLHRPGRLDSPQGRRLVCSVGEQSYARTGGTGKPSRERHATTSSHPLRAEPRSRGRIGPSRGASPRSFGEEFYVIDDAQGMRPFLMSVVSDSDHWLFVGQQRRAHRGPEEPGDSPSSPTSPRTSWSTPPGVTGPVTSLRGDARAAAARSGTRSASRTCSPTASPAASTRTSSATGSSSRRPTGTWGSPSATSGRTSDRFGFVRECALENRRPDAGRGRSSSTAC